MAVKIRLKRLGKIRSPHYRIVVADSRTKRDGRVIEEIGRYNPKTEPSTIEVDSDRAQYWLGVGAQPSDPVMVILKITGDWQKFRGEPGAEGTLRQPEAKPDRHALYEAAAREAGATLADEPAAKKAAPAKKSAAKKAAAEAKPAEDKPADDKPAGDKPAEDKPAEAVAEAAPEATPEAAADAAPAENAGSSSS